MKAFQALSIVGLALSLTAFLAGCGGSMESGLTGCKSGCEGDLGSGGDTPPDFQDEHPTDKTIDYNPTIGGGNFKGKPVISFDTQNKYVILRMPLPMNNTNGGVYGEVLVPEVPGMKITFDTYNATDSNLVVHIPVEAIFGKIVTLDPARLPNGDPIPLVPGGELPAVAVQVSPNPDLKAVVYLGAEYVGVYFINPDLIDNNRLKLSIPLKEEGSTVPVGYLHIIPNKVDAQFPNGDGTGGLFLAVQLPPEVSIALEDLL